MGGTDGRGPEGADKKKKKKTKRGARRNARYYCHYCDKNLANNYLAVRKQHCKGKSHRKNVKDYFASFIERNPHIVKDIVKKNMAPPGSAPEAVVPALTAGPGGMLPPHMIGGLPGFVAPPPGVYPPAPPPPQ